MADPLPWPSVLMPSSEDWSLRGGTRSGGQTFQGQEQIVASPTARWKATLNIPCWEPEHIFAIRRVIALGRSQLWYLGPYEYDRAPWPYEPLIGGLMTYRTSGLAQSPLAFSLSQLAELNDTAIIIQRDRGGFLAPGMLFSINGRMHLIADLTTGDPADPSSGLAAAGKIGVTIRPWLRGGYVAGTGLEFGTPICVMRLATDDTGAMELQLSRYGTVTLDFVEAF